LEHILNQCLR